MRPVRTGRNAHKSLTGRAGDVLNDAFQTFNVLNASFGASQQADGFLTLGMSVAVNGVEIGRDLLSNMGWPFEDLVAYASRGTQVRPGDVLGSGTCGNGGCLAELWGRTGTRVPPPLRPGDVVSMAVDGLGTLANTVVRGVDPKPIGRARARSRHRG